MPLMDPQLRSIAPDFPGSGLSDCPADVVPTPALLIKLTARFIEKLDLDDDMLVIAGDNLLDFSLTRFMAYAKEKQASCIMRYYEHDEKKLLKCGVVTIDETDRILRMTEKSPTPETHWCTPPFYYYTKEDAQLVAKGIEAGCGTDAPGSYIAWLCKQTPVYAMEMPGKRYDIGNLESYRLVQEEYRGITKTGG